ncbi:MAG: hypothetical protein ACUVXA_16040 [Candidatus Jordarchaeum sp.]|uniref:hypothetical protein n=1 Tax=Candidatus Jordarchaeum sp. TaxID=2823881 RepID=UPI00404A8EED
MKLETQDMFQEILMFLTFFSEALKKGNNPENSLKTAVINYSGPIKNQLIHIVNKIFGSQYSLKEAWNFFDELTESVQIKRLLWLVEKALTKNAQEAGKMLERAIWEIRENQQLVEERKNQLKAQSFKIKILSVASSAILGLISSLTPLFSISSQLLQYQITPIISSYFEIGIYWPTLITLGIISIMTSYSTAKISETKHPSIYALASILLFILVFILGLLITNIFAQKGFQ